MATGRTTTRWARAFALAGLTVATLALANSTAFVNWVPPQAYTDGTTMSAGTPLSWMEEPLGAYHF